MGEQGHTRGLQSKGQLPKSHRGFSVSVGEWVWHNCSELPRRKTRESEGLNTYWSSTPVIVKVTAASGGLATKSFLSIIIPDARGNFLPGSQNGCQQPLLLQFRWIPAHSLFTEGQEAAESLPRIGGEKKFSFFCCRRLDWEAMPSKAYLAQQPVAA